MEEIAGRGVELLPVDVTDEAAVLAALQRVRPDAVVHFAALEAVRESVAQPERYYRTNVGGTLNLVKAMDVVGCRTIVFSSSATVYGAATQMPLTEGSPLGATNPYGWTKFVVEQVLRDVAASDERWSVALLRYFAPVGQPGDAYTITATSHWVIDWAGGGAAGQEDMTLTADTSIRIGEAQAVITS